MAEFNFGKKRIKKGDFPSGGEGFFGFSRSKFEKAIGIRRNTRKKLLSDKSKSKGLKKAKDVETSAASRQRKRNIKNLKIGSNVSAARSISARLEGKKESSKMLENLSKSEAKSARDISLPLVKGKLRGQLESKANLSRKGIDKKRKTFKAKRQSELQLLRRSFPTN